MVPTIQNNRFEGFFFVWFLSVVGFYTEVLSSMLLNVDLDFQEGYFGSFFLALFLIQACIFLLVFLSFTRTALICGGVLNYSYMDYSDLVSASC